MSPIAPQLSLNDLLMHSDGKAYYPTRSFIRFQAKNLLIQELMNGQELTVVSRFRELGISSLQDPEQHDEAQAASTDSNRSAQPNSLLNDEMAKRIEVDEALFADVTSTVFHAEQHPELYQGNQSQDDVMQIEQAIAQEIVDAYQRIHNNRTDKTIQDLNALL